MLCTYILSNNFIIELNRINLREREDVIEMLEGDPRIISLQLKVDKLEGNIDELKITDHIIYRQCILETTSNILK